MTIFLIGFMGSGKTTVGKKLAAKLAYDFIDLDAAIEKDMRYLHSLTANLPDHV